MGAKRIYNSGFCRIIFSILAVNVLLLMPVSVSAICDPVRIMHIGDSITDGAIGGNDGTGFRRALYMALAADSSYEVDFVGSQSSGIPTDFDRDHEGHDGWRADDIRDNIYGWLDARPAEIVLLHIGANDINQDQGADGTAIEIGQILDEIDDWENVNGADISVVLARIVNRSDPRSALGLETSKLNHQIQSLADARIAAGDKIVVVDMESALTYPEDMADELHPNDAGYGKMAGVWYAALSTFLAAYCSDGPTLVNLSLASTSGNNLSTDDLTCSFDLAGSATTAATAWYGNGPGPMALYLPMEGGETDGLEDYSGKDVTVATGGTPAWSPTAGHDGNGAFVFDGNDVLDAGAVFPTLSSYSQTAWVKKASDDSWQNIISGTDFEHLLLVNNGVLKCGHNELVSLQDTETLTNGEWYHVAVTFDYNSGELILYKNGSPVAGKTVTAKDMNDGQLYVGGYGGGAGWRGVIDDVGIYESVLSPEQIAAMYNGGSFALAGSATTAATTWYRNGAGLMSLYLPMEGGESNALNDYSGNGIVVAANGDPAWNATAGHDANGAFEFDGDDDLDAGENFPVNSSYTKTAWVYRTGSGNNGGNNIVSGDENGGGHAFWAPNMHGNMLSGGHNGTWNSVQDAVPLDLNTWYFVALAYDADSDTMILYKNGVEVSRAKVPADVTDATISIGSFGYGKGWMWKGTIDDVGIYDRALSAEQIAAMYNGGGGDNNAIVSRETAAGEEWQCEVTPFSDSETGVAQFSNTLDIVASADADGDGIPDDI